MRPASSTAAGRGLSTAASFQPSGRTANVFRADLAGTRQLDFRAEPQRDAVFEGAVELYGEKVFVRLLRRTIPLQPKKTFLIPDRTFPGLAIDRQREDADGARHGFTLRDAAPLIRALQMHGARLQADRGRPFVLDHR